MIILKLFEFYFYGMVSVFLFFSLVEFLGSTGVKISDRALLSALWPISVTMLLTMIIDVVREKKNEKSS